MSNAEGERDPRGRTGRILGRNVERRSAWVSPPLWCGARGASGTGPVPPLAFLRIDTEIVASEVRSACCGPRLSRF